MGELHPNPASETATLSYQLPVGTATATLVLRDLTGRCVLVQVLAGTQGQAQVSVRELAAGFYLCALEAGGYTFATRKLSVIH